MYRTITVLIYCFWLSSCQTTTQSAISEQQALAILNELKEIKHLLKQRPLTGSRKGVVGPQVVNVQIRERPNVGETGAPLTLVEYTDFQCPYCRRFSQTTLVKLKEQFVKSGKLRILVKDLPLNFHKQAKQAAIAAHCANEQSKYWEYRNILFRNQKSLGRDSLSKYAFLISLDIGSFKSCMDSGRYDEQISQDINEARNIGVTGTPSFVLGKTKNGMMSGLKIVGAQSFSNFVAHINDALLPPINTKTRK